MPRKKSNEGKPVDAEGTELKAVRLELPIAVHQWLRVEAATHQMSMAQYARKLVEQDWEAKAPKSGDKK